MGQPPEPSGNQSMSTNSGGEGISVSPAQGGGAGGGEYTSTSNVPGGGQVTIADIISRPVIERRKRPIPRDPTKLVQVNAPVPPRRKRSSETTTTSLKDEASTSQVEPPRAGQHAGSDEASNSVEGGAEDEQDVDEALALQRGSRRKFKANEQVDDAQAKRIRNTLAARRHRLYKATQWKNMNDECGRLRARNAELESQAGNPTESARLTSENQALSLRVQQLQSERYYLLSRIETAEEQLRRMQHENVYP